MPGAGATEDYTFPAGTYFPMMGLKEPTPASMNLGQRSFIHRVPTGFKPGWFK